MTFLLALAALAAILAVTTVRSMVHDNRGTRRPPRSHADDPAFHSPGYLA